MNIFTSAEQMKIMCEPTYLSCNISFFSGKKSWESLQKNVVHFSLWSCSSSDLEVHGLKPWLKECMLFASAITSKCS
jgi:hypothetical protein